ncbi:low affinity potassium transport system protein kup [Candidatus Phycosocius bacilliformis]|uniref:Probable potassium transport system protein Kup n=1 Tax=Candidatus Phycosocius bacilliformis TaxID=1445552 RepID=A0A2P2E928_9PROT|nr:potassium transporter Kup [Candidatus Phycosocius bacilliformis]GBF57577.1 low affinity potassium transport system protein kup [Candidatus Phycosocius bacilliformis]
MTNQRPSPADGSRAPKPQHTAILTIGAIGVVFGDIGTSPLYAFREALAQAAGGGITQAEIFGVLSLALWALILVVTVKYVSFLMRADNHGEGGVLSLMALARRATGGRWAFVTLLGAMGAALFYGDAILTPALSVLSAVEGLKSVPAVAPLLSHNMIIAMAIALLVVLFLIQSSGTAAVAGWFGPICVVWFLAIGTVGLFNMLAAPQILSALNPMYGIEFLLTHGKVGLLVMGAVFLTVTGAEALTADMGHFGRFPIQLGWYLLVFPSLTLNYFGQGAFALLQLEAAAAQGLNLQPADWFFLMTPEWFRLTMVGLATAATIIASQAVITGAFSLTQQAVLLGLLPRMTLRQTSASHSGQIYLPAINWLLALGVLILILSFQTSSKMAAAYGIAVTGTMVVTTMLAFLVVWKLWQWSLVKAVAIILPLLALDMFFFGANILRVAEGGWVPLVVGLLIAGLIGIWARGRAFLAAQASRETVKTSDLVTNLAKTPIPTARGTAVFLTADPELAPPALLHNLKHNQVLHQNNILLTVRTSTEPHVASNKRLIVECLDERFSRATLHYGYMESPDVPTDLHRDGQVPIPAHGISFFVSRNSLAPSAEVGLPLWQAVIYSFLHRNAADPTAFFQIPPDRVVELGSRVRV